MLLHIDRGGLLSSDHDEAELRFCDLGTLVVERAGVAVEVRGRRQIATLALLLVHANRRVPTDTLIEAIWGDDASDGAAANLQAHVWRLRGVLEPDRRRGEAFVTVLHEADGYRLAVRPEQVDSVMFEQLVGEARDLLVSGQPDRALARCDQALVLWRGEPWSPHSDERWALASAHRLGRLHGQVRQCRVQSLLQLGEPQQALIDLETLLEADPLHESLWALSMTASYQAGHVDHALDTYRRARTALVDETGLEPGRELRELHAKVLARDPSLAGPRRRRAAAAERSAAATEVHLPNRRGELIGRSREVDELVSGITDDQLVTLVGAAGCGKTRLAIEVARIASDRFADGVWFVDLTAAGDGAELLDVVTSTIKLAPPEVGTVHQALRTFTRSRQMLLVLDNCEHVIDPVAELADSLLGPDSELTLLATSRMPLDVDGERVWSLDPLRGPEPGRDDDLADVPAVQLFVQRLRAAAPRLAIGPHELRLAAEICRQLDSLPLALELAAGQARSFSLDEIVQRVRSDPAGLARIGRGARHHASLRAAIESSVATVSPDELSMHRALAVVPGPVSTGMAAQLADLPSGPAAAALGNLANRSMLTALSARVPGRPSRFSQLVTIRAHGSSTVTDEERLRVERRRNNWVTSLVSEAPFVGDSAELEWFARLDDDLAAVRATLQHTLVERPDPAGCFLVTRLNFYWLYRGMIIEWGRWAELARWSPATAPDELLFAGASQVGAGALSGRSDLCEPWLDELDAYDHVMSDDQLLRLGQLLPGLAMTALMTNLPAVTRRAADRLEKLVGGIDDARLALLADVTRVIADVTTGDPEATLESVREVYARAEQAHNHAAGWMVAFVGSLAAVRARDAETGLHWSDRLLGQVLQLTSVNVPGIELRGALFHMAGRPFDAVADLTWSRNRARRHGATWPLLPSTPEILVAAQEKLSAGDVERAHRLGLQASLPASLTSPTTTP